MAEIIPIGDARRNLRPAGAVDPLDAALVLEVDAVEKRLTLAAQRRLFDLHVQIVEAFVLFFVLNELTFFVHCF